MALSQRWWPWTELNLDPTQDVRAIKSAYAKRLKNCRPDVDAIAYQKLRAAYDSALSGAAATKPFPLARASEPPPVEAQEPAAELISEAQIHAFFADLNQRTIQDWPAVQAALDHLPLPFKRRWSVSFAQQIARDKTIPIELMLAMSQFFDWSQDYRQRGLLGDSLHRKLNLTLANREFLARQYDFTPAGGRLKIRKLAILGFFFGIAHSGKDALILIPIFLMPMLWVGWYTRDHWWNLFRRRVQLDLSGLTIWRGSRSQTFAWTTIQELRIVHSIFARGKLSVKLAKGRPLVIPDLYLDDAKKIVAYFDAFQACILELPPAAPLAKSLLQRGIRWAIQWPQAARARARKRVANSGMTRYSRVKWAHQAVADFKSFSGSKQAQRIKDLLFFDLLATVIFSVFGWLYFAGAARCPSATDFLFFEPIFCACEKIGGPLLGELLFPVTGLTIAGLLVRALNKALRQS